MIPRGTTTEIQYSFDQVDVATITDCYLTLKQGSLVIEKTLADATVGENTLTWKLTQAETLRFNDKDLIESQIRYKANGEAYISKVGRTDSYRILKDGEI